MYVEAIGGVGVAYGLATARNEGVNGLGLRHLFKLEQPNIANILINICNGAQSTIEDGMDGLV